MQNAETRAECVDELKNEPHTQSQLSVMMPELSAAFPARGC